MRGAGPAGRGLSWVCAAVFAVGLAMRVGYAVALPVRMSADAAYYVAVAENLHLGRGLVVDYVWHYLAGVPVELPAPSNSYWMPGQSFVVAAAFGLARSTSLRVAQAPSLLLGALLCAITASLGGWLFRSARVALAAGAMAAVSFHLVGVSLFPDHFNLAACLVNGSLLAMWVGWRASGGKGRATEEEGTASGPQAPDTGTRPAGKRLAGFRGPALQRQAVWQAMAGVGAGLAYLTRGDGALLGVPAVSLAVSLARRGRLRAALAATARFVGGAAVVALPWMARQRLTFGSWWGAGALRTAFLRDYLDLFRLDQSHLTLGHYLSTNQVVAWSFKGWVLWREARLLAVVAGAAGLLALYALRRREVRAAAAPWLIYGAAAVLAPALVFPYPAIKGQFWHLLPGLCPIVFALAAGGLGELLGWVKVGGGGRAARAAGWVGLCLAFGWLLRWWAAAPGELARGERPLYPLSARQAVAELQPRPGAVLTDSAWGLWHVARVPCAQFPSDGAEAALAVAEALGAEYLITRADAPDRIPAMAEVMQHPRFAPHARHLEPGEETALLVYRILPPQADSARRRRMSQ